MTCADMSVSALRGAGHRADLRRATVPYTVDATIERCGIPPRIWRCCMVPGT
jgi:hypothetical protein